MKFRKIMLAVFAFTASAILLMGCASLDEIAPEKLTTVDSVSPTVPVPADVSDDFKREYYAFSLDLLRETADTNTNSLVSPLSVMTALAVTANGADTETRAEMESTLGGFPIEELNAYLFSFTESLNATSDNKSAPVMRSANSVWLKDSPMLAVNDEFLSTCAGYYGAEIYKVDFSKQSTVDAVNAWVKEKTNDMILKIADKFDSDLALALVNAAVFEAEWATPYFNVREGETFISSDGVKYDVDFLPSMEYNYIEGNGATGFIKPYTEKYAFAAFLPDGTVEEFFAAVTAEEMLNMISNATNEQVQALLPKFTYEFSVSLNETLTALGMPTAFEPRGADFSKMAVAENENIFISDVFHKTFIELTEYGTRAAAVTEVYMNVGSMMPQNPKVVTLNRPFIYAIVDTVTNLPVFCGIVQNIK